MLAFGCAIAAPAIVSLVHARCVGAFPIRKLLFLSALRGIYDALPTVLHAITVPTHWQPTGMASPGAASEALHRAFDSESVPRRRPAGSDE